MEWTVTTTASRPSRASLHSACCGSGDGGTLPPPVPPVPAAGCHRCWLLLKLPPRLPQSGAPPLRLQHQHPEHISIQTRTTQRHQPIQYTSERTSKGDGVLLGGEVQLAPHVIKRVRSAGPANQRVDPLALVLMRNPPGGAAAWWGQGRRRRQWGRQVVAAVESGGGASRRCNESRSAGQRQ